MALKSGMGLDPNTQILMSHDTDKGISTIEATNAAASVISLAQWWIQRGSRDAKESSFGLH